MCLGSLLSHGFRILEGVLNGGTQARLNASIRRAANGFV